MLTWAHCHRRRADSFAHPVGLWLNTTRSHHTGGNRMSLAGQAVVAIWNGIAPEGRTEFYEWHNREHMPERVGIPGFRRGRRYIAKYGTPEFFTLYEAESPEVLVGQDYLNRL